MSMRKEHDFSKGVRGKYSDRLSEGHPARGPRPCRRQGLPHLGRSQRSAPSAAVEREKADVTPGAG